MASELARVPVQVILADGRAPDRVWAIPTAEAADYMVTSVLQDPAWKIMPGLTRDDVECWQYAQAKAGLPGGCRPWQRAQVPGRSFKHTFALEVLLGGGAAYMRQAPAQLLAAGAGRQPLRGQPWVEAHGEGHPRSRRGGQDIE